MPQKRKTSMATCALCHSPKRQPVLYVPWIEKLSICYECMSTVVRDCDECVRMFNRLAKLLIIHKLHPFRTHIRNVNLQHVICGLSLAQHQRLESTCDNDVIKTQCHAVHAHVSAAHYHTKTLKYQLCKDCGKNPPRLFRCSHCLRVACSVCIGALMCEICNNIECKVCVTSCSVCYVKTCSNHTKQCTTCKDTFCVNCAELVYCDNCLDPLCFKCQQDTDENTLCTPCLLIKSTSAFCAQCVQNAANNICLLLDVFSTSNHAWRLVTRQMRTNQFKYGF